MNLTVTPYVDDNGQPAPPGVLIQSIGHQGAGQDSRDRTEVGGLT